MNGSERCTHRQHHLLPNTDGCNLEESPHICTIVLGLCSGCTPRKLATGASKRVATMRSRMHREISWWMT